MAERHDSMSNFSSDSSLSDTTTTHGSSSSDDDLGSEDSATSSRISLSMWTANIAMIRRLTNWWTMIPKTIRGLGTQTGKLYIGHYCCGARMRKFQSTGGHVV